MTPEVKQRIEQIRHGEVPEGYKRTALGIVPANWIETTLGEIYTERNEPGNDSLPLLMVSIHSGVSDGEVAEEDLPKKIKRIEDKSQYKHAMPGDLVFNMMRAWQGAIGSVRTEGMVSPAYIVAKPNDMVDPVFMDYYMKTPRMINMIRRQSYGVTDFRLRLYWDSFSPIPCVLPPIEEQRRIAEILSVQDTLISLQRKEVAAYQQLKKSFLAKLLPKGGSNEPELRFKGFTDAWEQRKLGDVGSVAMCRRIFKHQTSESGEIPFFKIGTFGGTPDAFISREQFEEFKTKYPYPEKGDILISASGSIGRTVEFTGKDEYFQDSNIVWLKHNKSIINPFLRHLYEVVEWAGIEGSTIKRLYNDNILKTEVLIPTVPEQTLIAGVLDNLDTLITLHQRKVDFTQTGKNVLMQLLLTGLVSAKRRNHGLLI